MLGLSIAGKYPHIQVYSMLLCICTLGYHQNNFVCTYIIFYRGKCLPEEFNVISDNFI